MRLVTIKGLAFRSDEKYLVAYKPDNYDGQLQFTKAEVEDAETLKWIFKIAHTTQIISCG